MALHEENQRLQRADSIDEGKILYPNKSESVALYDSDDGSLGYNADTASYQGNGEYDDEEYVVEDTLPHFYASGGAGMLSGIRDEDDVIEEASHFQGKLLTEGEGHDLHPAHDLIGFAIGYFRHRRGAVRNADDIFG